MTTHILDPRHETIAALGTIDARLRWLSSWTVHHAAHIRPKRDGLKVGGHQASCVSMTAMRGDAELDEGNIYECVIQARYSQLLLGGRLQSPVA
jgi:pyruvate dehydrogenase complex dehydrogenase (E1) component